LDHVDRTSRNRSDSDEGGPAIAPRKDAPSRDWLIGGGEMAKLIRTKDWSKTPLGARDSWPQSLRTTVSLAQASNSPISLSWGSGHVQIYNDGYWPFCGAMHPVSMGQDFRECWASAFPVIGDAYATGWSGKSAYLEKMRMFLDRYGFLEETWFTFSFSPITDESGGVGGVFEPVTDMTDQMLAERRARTLRELASRTALAKTTEDAFALSAQVLGESDLDIPFALFYLLNGEGRTARLVGHTGLRPGTSVAPEQVDLQAPRDTVWGLGGVARTSLAQQIDDVAERLVGLSVGPYPELPKIALALPIKQPGSEKPAAVMVVGISSRLPIDEPYRTFCGMVAASLSAALANARAYEDERQKSDTLAELDRAKTTFFSNVSHEFRTPLTLILSPLEDELAESQDPLPPMRRERLATAHRSSLRLLKLVNTLLDFSRVEAGRTQASYEATDLASDTAELASVFRSAIEKAGLTLVVDCPPLPEPIYVDREMWEKIVLNLLSHALKHTFAGSITVRLAWLEDHCVLTVADTGIGIRAEELPRLFERFHRVQGATSRSHEGTGIGLALVEELAKLHGGTVGVESEERKGSTFTVTLPPSRTRLPADRVVVTRPMSSTSMRAVAYVQEAMNWLPGATHSVLPRANDDSERHAAVSAAHPRSSVLWVDDNPDMRNYVRRLLAEHYEVRAVPDGLAALVAARQARPDLILSDVMMPGLDGHGLLREVRADPFLATIPVILLSARAGEDAVIQGLATGADDYLVKPFSARELLARVRTHLELARTRREWARKLERSNKELEQFAYIASHDLQEPLRMVRSYVQLLEMEYKGKLDSEADKYIHYAVDGVTRMQALISDLLALSSVDAAAAPMVATDTGSVLDAALDDLRLTISESGAVITKGTLPTVFADGAQLRLVFQNLISNAIKFRPTGKPLQMDVSSRRDGQDWTFSLRDNGIGIEPKHSERIFRMFQRLHGQGEYPGTGIGLAICKKVVERAGGRIWVESKVGEGSTFRFTLPDATRHAS
jgi:signal transduction histidine kinase